MESSGSVYLALGLKCSAWQVTVIWDFDLIVSAGDGEVVNAKGLYIILPLISYSRVYEEKDVSKSRPIEQTERKSRFE